MKKRNTKGPWNYTTFWLLINNSWFCAKNAGDFNARKKQARMAEKRTSYWQGQTYLETKVESL